MTAESHVDPTFLPEIGPNSIDILVSNPPYVLRKDLKALAPDIKIYEDLRALDGGADGLDVIESILKWASRVLKPGGKIFLETDPCHHILLPETLKSLANEIPGFKIQMESVTKDFCSKERFITLIKAS
jgi:release factor glutamine methyltransferase